MWKFEYRRPTTAPPAEVWRLWSDIARWPEWDVDLEAVTLDGEFRAGASGTLQPRGMDAFPFTITAAEPGTGYADETPLDGAVLRFEHEIVPAEAGNEIRQRVIVEGPAASDYFEEFARQIILDIPAALGRLAAVAEGRPGDG
jgi:uncharacterized protein YndB with AHSA1/START domain